MILNSLIVTDMHISVCPLNFWCYNYRPSSGRVCSLRSDCFIHSSVLATYSWSSSVFCTEYNSSRTFSKCKCTRSMWAFHTVKSTLLCNSSLEMPGLVEEGLVVFISSVTSRWQILLPGGPWSPILYGEGDWTHFWKACLILSSINFSLFLGK